MLGDVTDVTDLDAEAAWGGLRSGNAVDQGRALFPRIYEDETAE